MRFFRSLEACIWLPAALLVTWSGSAQGVPPAPRLRPDQILIYQLETGGRRSTKVESRVTSPQSPPGTDLNSHCLLQVNVVEVTASGFLLKTYLSEKDSAPSPGATRSGSESGPDKLVEVSISREGSASNIKGLDQLSPSQQFAWNAWLSRFTSSLTFPKLGVRRGQRWETSEPERAPSPIGGLSWKRKYEYVKQEPCEPSADRAAKGKAYKAQPAVDLCAVVLVRAQLHQKTSAKNATPPDYKLRGLTTRGTATGTNETILYISTITGIMVRSTEDVQQSMDAIVGLEDGSNQVRYVIDAKSRTQIQLLPDVPQGVP